MARSKNRGTQEVNAGSMADIAFLLLIFFLVTTQIATNKGMTMILPPKKDEIVDVPLQEKNILKIQINSADKVLVEEDLIGDVSVIREMVYDFVLNFGDPDDKKRGAYQVSDRETYNGLPANMQSYISRQLRNPKSSDGPSEAVVSIRTDRGSSYERFIAVLDEINAAYYRIYGERVNLTDDEYRKLNRNDPRQFYLYEQGKKGMSKSISLAEPTGNS